jgi:cyanate permease
VHGRVHARNADNGPYLGRETSILWEVGIIAVVTEGRLWSEHVGILFLTMIFVGVGIAICQTLLPLFINDCFSGHVTLVTGFYTAFFSVGATTQVGSDISLQRLLVT